ncbi:MAG: phosphoribosylformylglycinamidine synthase [Brumimicrobium sp.]
MIYFFQDPEGIVYAVQQQKGELSNDEISKLSWLFGNALLLNQSSVNGNFIGTYSSMVTPWSTNAVEITQNMGIQNIERIEEFTPVTPDFKDFDTMVLQKYQKLNQNIFEISIIPEEIREIDDIQAYNLSDGLSLNMDEVTYLERLSEKIGRKLTDSEVFAFSQANSEHCRHKIFNGTFVIDGNEMPSSLFSLIRKTSEVNPNKIVSAYKDNVAFVRGPQVTQFAPQKADTSSFYKKSLFNSVISLKAETHNFPTTVEPFSGAATGSGGEIRDRMAGGRGSLPLAGTAVYMTAYPRLTEKEYEKKMPPRKWLYQSPLDILIKASNGASDFGNKFGQPLITGSVFTFEHDEDKDKIDSPRALGYDKVIMQAGGIGYAKDEQSLKDIPKDGDKILILGGDNYRIGMGGAAVSSTDTGALGSKIELNAVQRSNPEMQKRVANVVRGAVEGEENPIVSIHDHGAGGHLNCLTELVEDTGGIVDVDKLPIGDSTLSYKEIIGNESQERMGLVVPQNDLTYLEKIAKRERSPFFVVGDVTNDNRFTFQSFSKGDKPMDFALEDFFWSGSKAYREDKTIQRKYNTLYVNENKVEEYLNRVLQLESVACKDWLTNKVDRCVSGRVAKQQCVGSLQLPLNNVGVMALDFDSKKGIATSVGHSSLTGLIDPVAGSRNSITEALTNLVFAPIESGIKGVSLSANWMWPCGNEGEDARLYEAVSACSDFAIQLGINIPTGKDSLSMTQSYPDKKDVISPGTVIISAAGECTDITRVIEPVLKKSAGSIYYIDLSKDNFKLGGSAFAQILGEIGNEAPMCQSAEYFAKAFNAVQNLIEKDLIVAGHDVSTGGVITTLLEMCFADTNLAAEFDLTSLGESSAVKTLFNENTALVLQAKNDAQFEGILNQNEINFKRIGKPIKGEIIKIIHFDSEFKLNCPELRKTWFKTSYLLDSHQTKKEIAQERFEQFDKLPLKFSFPSHFDGKLPDLQNQATKRPKAAIIREKGSNSEREMAHAMYLAGFDVKDVHMTDLVSGEETLEDVQFIGAVGGFSNSDVLGAAKGWAGTFKYNENARMALENFFNRTDTLSVGICNGCQLFMELGLINPELKDKDKMMHNKSGKFDCGFVSVTIQENNSVMLKNFAGSTLGIWTAHGEGRYALSQPEDYYNIVGKFSYNQYPHNPNGSDYNVAMMCDKTGRHLVTMPHFERSIFPWNWANYPKNRKDEVSPWLEAFVNARIWCENTKE